MSQDGDSFYISKKLNKGDSINEFHEALDNNEWNRYYNYIAENGYLTASIGDPMIMTIDNKIIFSEMVSLGKNKDDFQVTDVFKIENADAGDMAIIQESVERAIEGENGYDKRKILEFELKFTAKYGKEFILTEFSRDGSGYVDSASNSSSGRHNDRNDRTGRTGIDGAGVQDSNRQDMAQGARQRTDNPDFRELNNSNSETSDDDVSFSIPDDQRALLKKFQDGEIDEDEYLLESQRKWESAGKQYGVIESGENPFVKIFAAKLLAN